MVFTPGTGAEEANVRWAREYAQSSSRRRGRSAASIEALLTGVAWLCVATNVNPGHLNHENGLATVALCHSVVRSCARVGDVVFFVSAARPNRRLGIFADQRLLLGILVVTATLAPWVYFSLGAPQWAYGRIDRPYTCRFRRPSARQARDVGAFMLAEDEGQRARIAHRARANRSSWRVRYANGPDVIYGARPRTRIHGHGIVPRNVRQRDWRARVLASRVYVVFPADDGVVGHRW